MGDIEVAHYGAEARSYYLLAQRIFEKVYGKNSIEVANIYIKLSNLPESSSGSEASVYLEKALETMIAATGADSLETASCYMYLGDENEKYIENREDVVEYYKRALNIWILHKGENSPEALELYNRLYNVYIYMETDREKLGELLDKMYTISSALYGESDSETLEYNRLIGHLYYNDGPKGKTIEIWDKKLKTEISHYGEKSETVAETYTAYGYFYNDHKEYQKACEYLTKAHDIYIEILGKKDLKSQMIERAIKYIREEKMHKKSFWSRIFG
jgi:tetratricopeptide (TPR) repeat protein